MITAPPNSSMLSWHSCLAGRRNFYTKPLRNVDDDRTHGLLCAALIFVRRLQLVDCGSGTEKNLPKVIGCYDFLRLKHRERRLQDRSEHLRHGQSI